MKHRRQGRVRVWWLFYGRADKVILVSEAIIAVRREMENVLFSDRAAENLIELLQDQMKEFIEYYEEA